MVWPSSKERSATCIRHLVTYVITGSPTTFVNRAENAEPGHGGRLYEMTGPRLLTFADAIGEIAAATGRPITYQRAELDGYIAAMAEHDVPPDVVGLLGYLFGEVLDGRNAWVGDGVERALGRPAKDFSLYVKENLDAWRV